MYRWCPSDLNSGVTAAIKDGSLPQATYQRILHIGEYEPLDTGSSRHRSLANTVLEDAWAHRKDPDQCTNPITRELIWGDTVPATIVHSGLARYSADWLNEELPEPDYWNIEALASAIATRREDDGHCGDCSREQSIRKGLTNVTWRAIIAHIRPEVVATPEYFESRTVIGHYFNTYTLGDRTLTRRAIQSTLVHNAAMLELYSQAKVGGVPRIRPGLRSFTDIQTMLAEGGGEVWQDHIEATTGLRPVETGETIGVN